MKTTLICSLFLTISMFGCATKERITTEREHKEIQRNYVVTDSSSNVRPGWIEDAEVWSKANGKDVEKYRYFSFESEPKVSRQISCDIAKANARADIAGEIATFIDKSLATSQSGDASIDENNPHMKALHEYVETTLAEKTQALIHGAAVEKTYWELRQYQKEKGAKKDYKAYVCAAFIRTETKRLKEAVEAAANFVANSADDPETKENVKKALKDASENFVKAKKGEI